MKLKWVVKELEWDLQTNVVYRVGYIVSLKDEGDTVSAGGNILLFHPGMVLIWPLNENLKEVINADYVNEENFVPFDQLTPEIIIGWTQESLGTETVSELNDLLLRELQLKRNPKSAGGLPWST